MQNNKDVILTSVGHYIPSRVITNEYLSQNYNISEENILKKTGIKERRYADSNMGTTELAVKAIEDLLKNSNKSIEDIDCIIIGTLTPDFFFPSTAVNVINRLGAVNAWGFDLSAACSGFCYGVAVVNSMISVGSIRNAIVCGVDKMSSTLNSFDYKTAVLFGDGAGAVLLEASENEKLKVMGNVCKVKADKLEVEDVYFKTPFNTLDWSHEKFELQGGKVYRNGVSIMTNAINDYLQAHDLSLDNFDCIIPHQSNLNMIKDTAKELSIPLSKFKINIDKVGNTGGASIPICLSEFVKKGELHKGDRILMVSFGAGYTISVFDTYLNI